MKIKLMQPSSYASAVLAVALAASLATSQRASAQTCDPCPANAQDTAIGVAFGVFVTRGGIDVNVSSGKVGECEVVKLKANVSYNAFGISGGIGAGFQGGTGLYILPGSIPVNVTPADMATTKVGPAPCGTVPVKPMIDHSYILTAADKAAGIATFTFTYTNGISLLPNAQGQCVLRVQASPQQSVAIVRTPTCSILPPTTNVCEGVSASFTATGSGPADGQPWTFVWRGPGGFTQTNSGVTSSTITVSVAGTYTNTLIDAFGCSSSCTATLVVNPNPTCTITGPDPVCDGTTNVYTSAVLPAGGTVTHSWSITGNGTILGSTTGASISVRATAAGNFTVTDNVTRDGCPGVCNKTVVVNPNPTCTITGPDPVCDGTTNVYTSAVLPAGGTVTHSWSITGNGAILGSTTGASISVRATGAGNFTVTDNVTRNGCPGVCAKTVVVNPNPTCTITGPDPVCDGTTNVYTSAVLPAGGTVTHSWSITGNGTILGSTTGASISVRATGAGNFTVTDNITRDGCPGVCAKTVVVNPNPTCTITGPDPVCDGTTNVYTSAVLPAGGTVTHSWSITGNGTILGSTTGASISVRATGAGNFTVTDNITRNGCPGVCAKTVVVNPNPTCTITGPDPVCDGTTNVYTSAVLPAGGTVTHSWSITGSGTILGSTTGASISVRATGAGNFTVTDNVTRDGCPGVCSKTVVVTPNPTCTITGPDPVCDGTTNVYTSAVLPAGGTVTHSWSVTGNGTILGSTTGASISVRATGAGNFTVTDNVTRDGCPGVCSKTVVVNPNPTCTITGPDPVCDGTTNVYTSAVLPAGGTVTHSWSITGNGTILGSTTGASISVRATGAGNFTVTDNVTRDGCPGVCSKTVVVTPNPTCTITGPTSICGLTTNVYTSTVLPAGGTVTHSWSITGSGTIVGSATGASVTVVAGPSGSFTLTDNTTRDGCPGVCQLTVAIQPRTAIGDFVWEDIDQDGCQGVNELGIRNVTVQLFDCASNLLASTTTDAQGLYLFDNRCETNFIVRFVAPPGYLFTKQDQCGNDNTDSDANPVTGVTGCVIVPPGTTNRTVDAGLIRPVPLICVTKDVVCELPSGCDTNWSKLAIGVRTDEDCPAFCYRITVRNCGNDVLTNVTLQDAQLGAYFTNCSFPTMLGIGQSYTCVIPGVISCDDEGGPVVACGLGVLSGITVCTNDTAGVEVREISLTCDVTVNGEHFIEIPCDGQPHLVTNTIRICNTGELPLSNIRLFAPHLVALGGACANIQNIVLSLDPGQCTNVELCVDAPVCEPDCGIAFSNYVQVTGTVDLSKTNVCAYTRNATNGLDLISTSTECEAVVGCVAPNACRVTGGGRQDDPIVYPADVRYVTHGGQVGAPVGNRVCEVTDDFYLGNPCIHGRWTHVRHQKGGLRGNFHARYYDTLECACLDTNIVDGFYAAGTVDGEVCGNRNIGPLPRKAPANKIVFTGVGDWADPNGRRAPRATLFRVDIEDRGEPGNAHALDRNGKEGRVPDRYRIRIWVLTNQELALLRGGGTGSDKYLLGFRNAISACNGMTAPDGAVNGAGARVSIVNGTAVFGVRAPDIDDGGELLHGNHQIHPAIKNCDPFNPTGPGLPPGGN